MMKEIDTQAFDENDWITYSYIIKNFNLPRKFNKTIQNRRKSDGFDNIKIQKCEKQCLYNKNIQKCWDNNQWFYDEDPKCWKNTMGLQ